MSPEAQAFNDRIATWSSEKLLDRYAQAFAANRYGSHDEEMAIIKAEILRRTNENNTGEY